MSEKRHYYEYGYMGLHGYSNFVRNMDAGKLNEDEYAKMDEWKVHEFITELAKHIYSALSFRDIENTSNRCRKFATRLNKFADILDEKIKEK